MSLPDSGIRGLIGRPAAWFAGNGQTGDVAIASRVRLARNLAGERFPGRAGDEDRQRIRERIREAARQASYLTNGAYWPDGDLSELDRTALVERRQADPAWARQNNGAGIVIDPGQMMSLMINGEDHLRLQSLLPGFDLIEAFRMSDQLDDQLAGRLPYAFSETLGFLTASPANAGTGLRASLLAHVPALALTGQLNGCIEAAGKQGMVMHGLFGDGPGVMGNLFLMSNRTALGRTELEIIEQVERAGRQVIGKERQARETMLGKARNETEDKFWRAHAILSNARALDWEEFLNLSSAVRLGIAAGVLNSPPLALLNELLATAQPAHLQLLLDRPLEAGEIDVSRAELVRRELNKSVHSSGLNC